MTARPFWEAARALARRLSEQVSARRGEALWLRDYPAAVDGDVGRVVLGVARGGVHRSCAVVNDLGSLVTITIERRREGAAVWQCLLGREPGIAAAIDAIDEALSELFGAPSPDDADGVPRAAALEASPGMLDAALAMLDGLGQTLAVPEGRWRLELWGEDRPTAGASISLAGGPHAWDHLITCSADARGARLRFPAAAMGATDATLTLPTLAALVGALADAAALARAAIDGRAAFRARVPSALGVAERLAEALRAEGLAGAAANGGRDDGFPTRWPRATVVEKIRRAEHPLIELKEEAATSAPADSSRSTPPRSPVVAVTIDDHVTRILDEPQLEAELPELLAHAKRRAARLTPARLIHRQLYEVLQPFHGLSVGQRVRYTGCHSDPRGEVTEYRFGDAAQGQPQITLLDDRDRAVLKALHLHLAHVRRP